MDDNKKSMSGKTYEFIVELEKPVPVDKLENLIEEGAGLEFPIKRSYEMNLLNTNWDRFVSDMAIRCQDDITSAIARGDVAGLKKIMAHVAGINSMYRLNDASCSGNILLLNVGLTDFREYVGTLQQALVDGDFRKALMEAGVADFNDCNHYFANPLATCSNIVTSDGFIPIGVRSNKVAIYRNVPHLIGGYVKVNGDNKPDFSVKDVDFYHAMQKELSEELGLESEDIVDAAFMGIIRNVATRGPEVLYNIRTSLSADELHKSWSTRSKDKFEHRNIAFYQKRDLPEFLQKNSGTMVPSGEATLDLFLKHY